MSEPKSSVLGPVKGYFTSKDYRFYIIAAGSVLILAGASFYYLRTPKPPKPKTRSKRRSSRPAGNADAGTSLIELDHLRFWNLIYK